jgi:DnaJ-class molecular chaperone
MKIKNYQTMLGLLPDKKYTLEELKKKYKIAALKHHPDKHFNSQESTIKFKEINEAYLYLYGKHENHHDNQNDKCNNAKKTSMPKMKTKTKMITATLTCCLNL